MESTESSDKCSRVSPINEIRYAVPYNKFIDPKKYGSLEHMKKIRMENKQKLKALQQIKSSSQIWKSLNPSAAPPKPQRYEEFACDKTEVPDHIAEEENEEEYIHDDPLDSAEPSNKYFRDSLNEKDAEDSMPYNMFTDPKKYSGHT